VNKRRSYQQFCGVARALDLVGERWTLLIIRNLLLGPRRYTDLLAELPGITTNLLAKRLQEMEAAGLLAKHDRRRPAGAVVYALTPAGEALDPVINELGRWGGRLMDRPRPSDRIDLALGLLSLRRRYRGGLNLTLGVAAPTRSFSLRFEPERLVVRDQPAEHADLTLTADEPIVGALFMGQADAGTLVGSGKLRVGGATERLGEVLAAFGLSK